MRCMQSPLLSSLVTLTTVLALLGCGSSSANAPPAEAAPEPAEAAAPAEAEPMAPAATTAAPAESSAPSEPAAAPSPDGDKKGVTDDSRTTESIKKIVVQNRPAFKKCYEDARKLTPDLKGTVMLRMELDAAGKVKTAGVALEESTIKDLKLAECITKIAKGLSYPASTKGLDKDFEYEFGFGTSAQ